MCGIAGIVDREGREATVERVRSMCATLRHRGPDDEGIHAAAGGAIGMRRLSIIDLATGRQPIADESGRIQVVLNGEIYNYRELRRDLEARGHRFATVSDTESIVHLYEDHGADCVHHLRGMFAFAVWDEPRRRLLLARDRLGVKPLYYAESGGRLAFASELKALLALPWIEPEIEWSALSHLFSFLTTPAGQSIVKGVRKLPPAHRLIAAPGQPLRIERWWDVRFAPDPRRRADDAAEELRARLDESVRLRLVSDVPLGAFLSGGLDSSAVVAVMARHTRAPVKTFTIGFREPAFDESAHARRVARAFGTEHHELVLEPQALDLVEDIAWHLDEPFGDSSAIPTYMVSRLAAERVKVVLSGDGGDEVFGGYERYLVEQRRRRLRLPAGARRLCGALAGAMPLAMRGRNRLRTLSLAGPERYLDASTLFSAERQERLFTPEAWARLRGVDPWDGKREILAAQTAWPSPAQYLDLMNYLPLDIMTKVDRMSMAHSLEAREPLLDHRLIEFAATLPPDLILRGGTGKWIFKKAMRGVLPDEIIDRPKHGFAVPLGRWFRGSLSDYVRDLLLSRRSRERGIFRPEAIEALANGHASGRDLDLHLWTVLSFELWCRAFADAPARVEVACASR